MFIIDVIAPADLEEIVIPAYVDGKRVVGLDWPAFSDFRRTNPDVRTVYLPETLVWLSPNAFNYTGIRELYIAGESVYINGDSGVDYMREK